METLGLALGTGFSSGLNLYATVATLGLLQRSGVLHLPPGLQVLSHPWVLGIALALYLIEFLADKIPYFDMIWDAIHTFIRPPAAALLAYAAAGGAAPEWRWGATLIAGGIALTAHGTKASARAAPCAKFSLPAKAAAVLPRSFLLRRRSRSHSQGWSPHPVRQTIFGRSAVLRRSVPTAREWFAHPC